MVLDGFCICFSQLLDLNLLFFPGELAFFVFVVLAAGQCPLRGDHAGMLFTGEAHDSGHDTSSTARGEAQGICGQPVHPAVDRMVCLQSGLLVVP